MCFSFSGKNNRTHRPPYSDLPCEHVWTGPQFGSISSSCSANCALTLWLFGDASDILQQDAGGWYQAWESSPFPVGFVWTIGVPMGTLGYPRYHRLVGSVHHFSPKGDSGCSWGTPFWSRARSPCWHRWSIPSSSLTQMKHHWNWDFVKPESVRAVRLTMICWWCLNMSEWLDDVQSGKLQIAQEKHRNDMEKPER